MEKFSGFYKLSIEERMKLLKSECKLSDEEVEKAMKMGWLAYADRMDHPSEDDESF